jgi:tetratricopeptide (TPR) repeat protein
VAEACDAAGRRHEAIRLYEELRDARQRELGPDSLDTLSTLHNLGVAYGRTGRPSDAVVLLERVRDGQVRQLGEDHDQTLSTRQSLSGAYLAARRPKDAIDLAEQVWTARVKKHGDEHPLSIAAMGHLAYIYQGGYRMREALELQQRARDQIVPKLGDYHPLSLQILRNLGHMLRVFERTDEAIPILERVRERELMVHGGLHPNTLVTLNVLGNAYRDAGDLNKALTTMQQAASGVEQLNFEHSHAGLILGLLALVHEDLKQFEQSELIWRKALVVAERKFGADSDDCAAKRNRIASMLLKQKKPADAEPVLRQALDILERSPNAGEKYYAQSLLGFALADQEKFDDAEPLLREAYLRMKNFAVEHRGKGTLPRIRQVEALRRLVRMYEAWDKTNEATKWRKVLEVEEREYEEIMKPNKK